MNIIEITNKFPTELDAIQHFEKIRWGNKPKCSYCGSVDIGKRNKDYRFHCKNCDKSFSVTTNTHLHDTRLPIKTWLYAFAVICDAKKGMSAMQLQRNIGVHYETAWTMYMRIREMMLEPICLDEILEIDNTMVGGKPRKKPKELAELKKKEYEIQMKELRKRGKEIIEKEKIYKKKYPKEPVKRGAGADRPTIAGIVERDGDVVAQVMSSMEYKEIKALVEKHVNKEKAVLISDEHKSYVALSRIIDNIVIDHKTMYAHRGIHTNTIESFWALIKRGLHGQYHHVSTEYLPDYVTEFVFKWNNRNEDDMFETLVKNSMRPKRKTKPITEGCKTN